MWDYTIEASITTALAQVALSLVKGWVATEQLIDEEQLVGGCLGGGGVNFESLVASFTPNLNY